MTTKTSSVIIENADYIVLPTSIIAHETEVSALDELKNKKFFVTGIFGNIFKDKYLKQNSIVVKNESEVFFFNLNKSGGINKKNLDNLFINKELTNSYYEQVSLDELPFPDWESYIKNYPLRNNFFSLNQKIAIPLLGTRGCPYSCFNYCTYPLQQGRKVRARSVENIILEIKFWQKKLGTSKFVFRDPVFSIDKKHTIQLCKEIIQQSLNIKFMIETHLNNLDDEMIPLLATAGLELVYVGVESSNMNVLKDMKRFTIKHDEQYKVIKKCEDAGIKVKTMFIFGSPEDTEETILDTIEYSKYLPSLYAQYSIFTPYPGTPIYNEYKEKVYEKKFENFNQYKLVFKHKNLSEEQIEKLKSLAYYKYYFNIKKIFTILKYFINSMYAKNN